MEIFPGIRKITETVAALAAISFVFYFIGFVDKSTYFYSLGINKIFLDFDYQQYVFSGALDVMILIIAVAPLFLRWYLVFNDIRTHEMDLLRVEKEIGLLESNPEKRSYFEKGRTEMLKENNKKTIEELAKLKSTFLSKSQFRSLYWSEWVGVVVGLLIILAIVFMFSKNYTVSALLSAQALIMVIVSFIMLGQIKRCISVGARRSYMTILNLIVITIFLVPITLGYMKGVLVKMGYFEKMEVVTKSEVISDVNLIGISKDTYIFLKSNEGLYIPMSEIKQIKTSTRDGS